MHSYVCVYYLFSVSFLFGFAICYTVESLSSRELPSSRVSDLLQIFEGTDTLLVVSVTYHHHAVQLLAYLDNNLEIKAVGLVYYCG